MARRLAWEPARRRVCASPRESWGQDGGPPREAQPPGGGGERASRVVLRLGRILAFLPSLLVSSPAAATLGLWCPGTLRLGWRPGMPHPQGSPESGPLPTSFYKRSKLLPTPTRPPKAKPQLLLTGAGTRPLAPREWKLLAQGQAAGERQRDDSINFPPGPGYPSGTELCFLETVTAAGLGPP